MRKTNRTRHLRVPSLIIVAALLCVTTSGAATFTIVNEDGLGEGFNDPTAATPVGGNTGTTIGEQRLIAFQYAADLWGTLLASDIEIRVAAKFDPLSCGTNSGVLGSAGPITASKNFPDAPLTDTYYVAALANALSGSDQAPAADDLAATFNSMLGTPGCLQNSGFYLGLDGNTGGFIDFVSVLAHELGHGLGFLSLVNPSTGELFNGDPDTYVRCLGDHSTGKSWPDMSNAERLASMIDGTQSSSDLHWTCQNAVSLGDLRLGNGIGGGGHIEMYAPDPFESGSSISHYAKTLAPNELMEPSYTGPNHDVDMSVALLEDLGWPMAITDCSGEMDGTPCDDADVCTAIDLCDTDVCTGPDIPGCTTTTTSTTSTTTTTTTTSTTTTTTFPPPTTTTTTATTTTTTTTLPPPPTTTTVPVDENLCGDAVGAGFSVGTPSRAAAITASDALYVLNAAVGSAACELCVCDVNDSAMVTATDALFVLNAAVGLEVTLVCPAC